MSVVPDATHRCARIGELEAELSQLEHSRNFWERRCNNVMEDYRILGQSIVDVRKERDALRELAGELLTYTQDPGPAFGEDDYHRLLARAAALGVEGAK